DDILGLAPEDDQRVFDPAEEPSSAHSHLSNPFATPTDYHPPPTPSPPPSRPPSAFTRLKNFSRTSLDHLPPSITRTSRTRHSSHLQHKVEVNSLRLDFPQPPT